MIWPILSQALVNAKPLGKKLGLTSQLLLVKSWLQEWKSNFLVTQIRGVLICGAKPKMQCLMEAGEKMPPKSIKSEVVKLLKKIKIDKHNTGKCDPCGK